jgi:hypothetical protein
LALRLGNEVWLLRMQKYPHGLKVAPGAFVSHELAGINGGTSRLGSGGESSGTVEEISPGAASPDLHRGRHE